MLPWNAPDGEPGAALAYICADRWMRNQYGADLRELITDQEVRDALERLQRAQIDVASEQGDQEDDDDAERIHADPPPWIDDESDELDELDELDRGDFLEDEDIELQAGASSADIRLTKTVRLTPRR